MTQRTANPGPYRDPAAGAGYGPGRADTCAGYSKLVQVYPSLSESIRVFADAKSGAESGMLASSLPM